MERSKTKKKSYVYCMNMSQFFFLSPGVNVEATEIDDASQAII